MSKVVISLCAFVVFVLGTPVANADPLVVTSGTASISGTAVITYNLIGQNFQFTSLGGDTGASQMTGCHPCGGPLNPVPIGGFFVGSSLGQGSAMLNGTTFNPAQFLGTFNIGGASVFLSGQQDITVIEPFSFSGDIMGCQVSISCVNVLFPSQQVMGQGLVTVVFSYSGQVNGFDIWDFRSANFVFTSAPVPEPMTLTLLATGLIGVGAKLRSRNRKRSR